jgi:PAS domain S-box-containing protein
MEEHLSYEELYKRYQDLHLRVTRFSSIEQALINARDKLDQELVLYKKLNDFNSQGLKSKEINQFLKLVVESAIDIFEVEIGYVTFQPFEEGHKLIATNNRLVCVEGAGQNESQVLEELDFLIDHNIFGGKIKLFDSNEIIDFLPQAFFSSCLISKRLNIGLFGELVIACGIGRKKAANYKAFDSRSLTLFTVFVQQIEAYLSNMLAVKKNKVQLELISKSELELKKLSLIATRTKSGVIISDKYGKIEWVNNSFIETTGYSLEEVKGRKPKEFLQTDDPLSENAKKELSYALAQKKAVEVIIQNTNKTGGLYYIQLEITPIFNEENDLLNFIAIQKDISEEFRYKKQLENINSRFELITQGANIGIWENDIINQKTVWNEVLMDLYGLTNDLDEDLNAFWSDSVHPDDYVNLNNEFQDLVAGKTSMVNSEYRIILKKKDNKVCFVRSLAIAEKDENNRVNRILGTTVDITEAHHAEQRLLEKNEELIKINGELDQFVYSVSHDLRSPLLSIKGILSLINTSENEEERLMYLSLISKSVDRLDTTVLEILDYSRNARLENVTTEFDFKELIDNIFGDLAYIAEENVDLRLVMECPEMVHMDKPRMDILMKNLISNGIKYRRQSKEGSYVEIKLQSDSEHFYITISDNGEGITEENQEKVFDMFYRASTTSAGTGLGLYICKDIISKLNGKMILVSEFGEGTVIKLTLPKINKNESLSSN